jgi:hypothetical protein
MALLGHHRYVMNNKHYDAAKKEAKKNSFIKRTHFIPTPVS